MVNKHDIRDIKICLEELEKRILNEYNYIVRFNNLYHIPQESSAIFRVEMNCGIIKMMLTHRRGGPLQTYASGETKGLGEGGSFHL